VKEAGPVLAAGRFSLATLQQRIVEQFLAKLAESKDVDADKIAQLKKLLSDSRKPKADDFVKVFSLPAGGDVK
jgi:hypothetical protein